MKASGSSKHKSTNVRASKELGFLVLAVLATATAIIILAVMLGAILYSGLPYLTWDFLTGFPSKDAANSGFKAALFGSIMVLGICAVVGIPLGVASAILLEEYQPKNLWLRRLHGIVQLNITNLAGVPSIVYGILGLTAFAQMFGLFSSQQSSFVIGQTWYLRYMDLSETAYYLPVANQNVEPEGAHQNLSLLKTASRSGEPAEFEVVPADKVVPLQESVKEEIDKFRDALNKAINETRGPRGIAAAKISANKAEEIVDSALGAATFRKDIASERETMIRIVAAMDGLKAGDLRAERQKIYSLVDQKEKDALLEGTIVEGTEPTLVGQRSWYYFTLPFGRGVLAGALTLMLVILPIIIVATQEALRAVPQSMRHGALALGATKWQSIGLIALPAAIPGICTGAILALSRAIGEAAPLLIIAGIVFITFTPGNLMDDFTVMPLQIYNWAGKPGGDFHKIAATGIIVLLTVLMAFNALAVFIRNKFQRPLS
jgi:phosphate transport system permease protein